MRDIDYDAMAGRIENDLAHLLASASDPDLSPIEDLIEIQPTRGVIRLAARAAAAVFVAWERGTNLGS